MKRLISYGLAAAMMLATAMATPALAKEKRSFDVCAGLTDVATQDDPTKAGASLTVAANIFPKGTIPMGGVAKCSDITATPFGTFYANVSLQAGLVLKPKGLPAAPDVQSFVTWQFDFSPKGTFATIGSVPISTGPGQTYIQTLVGSSGEFPGNGQVTVKSLDPTGFQFRITLPASGD